MKKQVINKVALVIVAIFGAAGMSMALGLASRTFVAWWHPTAICTAISAIVAIAAWKPMRRVTGCDAYLLNFIAATAVSTAILTGTFYTVNYFASDAASGRECTATVERRYSEERTRTRRIGRHTGARTERYTAYVLELRLPDGRTFTMEVPAYRYSRTRAGAHVAVRLERGFFGYDVRK